MAPPLEEKVVQYTAVRWTWPIRAFMMLMLTRTEIRSGCAEHADSDDYVMIDATVTGVLFDACRWNFFPTWE